MSENKIRKIEITAFIAACILGVLFHFVYDWTGKNPAAAAFFPVNESTWEHLKLVFFPILILSFGDAVFPFHGRRLCAQLFLDKQREEKYTAGIGEFRMFSAADSGFYHLYILSSGYRVIS